MYRTDYLGCFSLKTMMVEAEVFWSVAHFLEQNIYCAFFFSQKTACIFCSEVNTFSIKYKLLYHWHIYTDYLRYLMSNPRKWFENVRVIEHINEMFSKVQVLYCEIARLNVYLKMQCSFLVVDTHFFRKKASIFCSAVISKSIDWGSCKNSSQPTPMAWK